MTLNGQSQGQGHNLKSYCSGNHLGLTLSIMSILTTTTKNTLKYKGNPESLCDLKQKKSRSQVILIFQWKSPRFIFTLSCLYCGLQPLKINLNAKVNLSNYTTLNTKSQGHLNVDR